MKTVLLVGAGLTSATIAASLKTYASKVKCICIDVREHIGGNCYDYKSRNTFVSKYGPHLWHSKNAEENEFIFKYGSFKKYDHRVSAEINDGLRVPFPYSKETEKKIGRALSEQDVIDMFFKPYSQKMWDMEWDDIPNLIKGRVPKNTNEKSLYFPGQYCGVPVNGYTELFYNMFDDTEMILGANQDDWQNIKADIIVYCGRLDRILNRNTGLRIGEKTGKWLKFRNLNFILKDEEWDDEAPVVNFCNLSNKYTRKTSYKSIYGGNSNLVSYELPCVATIADLNPYYPIPTHENYETHNFLQNEVKKLYPNMIIAGRTAQYLYMDMNTCVGKGLRVSENIIKTLG